ncbi:MAG: recombinase family protein, partial [Verrucomicrobia bacterium]|nr:recombinase family protein [Verrucomicrobiota bacterium]
MKFFLYARKSTEDEARQVLSIDSQLDELREFARKESLQVVREYVEAKTAKEPGRPVFNEMMEAVENGEAEALLAWHPDRLSRNSVDGGRLVHDLDTGKLRDLKFPSTWFENTPQGKFVLSMALEMAKYYVDHLSVTIRRGIRKKLRDGIYPNMPPPGYMNDPQTRTIIFDEERAPIIRRMFEAYATGDYSGADIRRMAEEWGLVGVRGKLLSMSRIHAILANTFYIGIFRFSGEVYEGKHPPLITRELFKRVQEVRERRSRRRRPKKHPFPLRGLIRCHECGCMVTATKKKGHSYYHCGHRRGPCPTKTIREEALAELLRESIRRVSIPEDWADKMLAEVRTWKQDEDAKQADIVAGQKAELDQMQERLDRLLDAYIEGILDKDEFAARKEQYVNRKAELTDSVARFESGGASRLEPLISFITDSRQARYDAESESLTDLRKWHHLVGSNLLFASEVIQ